MRRLRRSGLLAADELLRAYELAGETPDGAGMARLLVEHRLLTTFQARMILAGRVTGFQLGQYRILEPIGRGGMGRVFKAEHVGMGRIVAVKVLAPGLLQTERARRLFQTEVKVAAQLAHPNIVTAYDANEVGERHFLVMEFVDGPDLQGLVDEQGPLSIGTACDFMRQAALGLQYAHERGLVHRDIKPSNLLVQRHNPLGPGCVVKILDFGLARLHRPKDDEEAAPAPKPAAGRTVMGTPDYLSPEQGRNLDGVDIRSDLYSLGCTLYFLLVGHPPFPDGSALEKLVRHGSEEPESVMELRPEVPQAVADIIDNLIAKNPLERYQIPLDAALALVPFSAQTPGFLMPPGGPESNHSINLGGTWPGHDTGLSLAGSSFLLRRLAPPERRRWDWIQFTMLGVALALGFALGAAALAVILLMQSRGN